MLVFSAITPHPPLIIPTIGEGKIDKISKTISSLEQLNFLLIEKKLDSLIVITPHGTGERDFFVLNMSTGFNSDFKSFGDFITTSAFACDIVLTQQIKEANSEIATYVNSETIDHGVTVPLFYLLKNNLEVPIVVLNASLLSYEDHYNFGKNLQSIINDSSKRIGVIASGDLSHRLSESAPGGFSANGEIFDKKIFDFIKNNEVKNIINIDKSLAQDAGECGLGAISLLYGILHNLNYKTEILSYESPFGVGYLTVNFEL
jgi:AmmeMemoRadiSam system protein B